MGQAERESWICICGERSGTPYCSEGCAVTAARARAATIAVDNLMTSMALVDQVRDLAADNEVLADVYNAAVDYFSIATAAGSALSSGDQRPLQPIGEARSRLKAAIKAVKDRRDQAARRTKS